MNDRYLLYAGCLIPTRLPFLDRSSHFVLDKLEIEYEPFPDATCCVEPIGLRSLGYDTWLAVTARLLSIAEENEKSILSLCNGCFMSLKEAEHLLRDDELRSRINEVLAPTGREYHGRAKVRHFLEVVGEQGEKRIRSLVSVPQERLKLALHPGCHLVRPSEVLRVEGRYTPQRLSEIASWTGAGVVDNEDWPQCCGGGLAGVEDAISLAILNESTARFKGSGANAILTPCPFCFVQFDIRQKEGLPVLYLAELLSLSFGASAEEIGLKYHRTKFSI